MQINFTGLSDKEAAFVISALSEFPIKACGNLHAKLTEQYATQVAASHVSKPAADAERPQMPPNEPIKDGQVPHADREA